MAARLSALCAGCFLAPGRFLVLIFVRGWVDVRAIVRLEGFGKLKESTSSGTRTDDLPACSIVPQPTTLPRARSCSLRDIKKSCQKPLTLSEKTKLSILMIFLQFNIVLKAWGSWEDYHEWRIGNTLVVTYSKKHPSSCRRDWRNPRKPLV
jgi:hypothetical protein